MAVVGSWAASQSGGAMIWVDHASGRYRLTLGGNFGDYLDSGRAPAVGRWQHVAATYDGTTARFYVDGAEVASKVFTGNVGNSNVWRIGAYGVAPTGFFDGSIDDVRIYDRALTASEIEAGMATRIQPDRTPPTVTSSTPAGWRDRRERRRLADGDVQRANAGSDDHGGRASSSEMRRTTSCRRACRTTRRRTPPS